MSATSEKDEVKTPESALSKAVDDPLTKNRDLNNKTNKKEWVKFENEEEESKFNEINLDENKQSNDSPAVLDTESVHVTIDKSSPKHQPNPKTSTDISKNANKVLNNSLNKTSQPAVINLPDSSPGMRTIELSTGRIREGFANGDIIVTLLPVNVNWPWITPAVFRPELVPEELMAQGLTLTVEEYVMALETLVNDYRFTLYNICYKRVLVCWILLAFSVLLGLLFSGITGILLFSLGVGWLFLNAVAIFLCMWVKLRLARGLEKCLARVNKQLLRHKIIIALDDRGNISCHKVNLCFIYFDAAQCISYLNNFLERNEQSGTPIQPGWESRLDIPTNDIVIQGANTTRISRKQERGEMLLLRYTARWGHECLRGMLDVSSIEPARHLAKFMCPCQYIECHLKCKPQGYPCLCCNTFSDVNQIYTY
ncbi:unnamed protein product [Diamesa serratosioi]